MKRSSQQKNNDTIGIIVTKLEYIQGDVKEIKIQLSGNYVTKDQFEPVRKIVYGMVSIILLAVMGAIIALVVKQQ
jgi:hypothetical protein